MRDRTFLLILLLASALLHTCYLWEIHDNPFFENPVLDEAVHVQWASALANGETWFPGEPYFRAPLYPLFLALLFKIGGIGFLFPRIVQAAIGIWNPVLLYLLGSALFPRRIAAVAAIALTASGSVLYFNTSLLIVSILLPLNLLALLLLTRASAFMTKPSLWLGAGLLLGLSAIARPNILLFAMTLPLWILILPGINRRSMRRVFLPLIAGIALPIVPVTLHNIAAGEPVLISWQGGTNFYIGNNPESDGMTAIAPGTDGTWWGGYHDMIRIAEENEGRTLARREVSAHWFRKSLSFLSEDPGGAARLFAKKIYILLNDFEVSNNQGIYFFRRYSRILSVLIHVGFGLLVPLACAGFVLVRWTRQRLLIPLFLLSYGLSIVLFFVTARYRIPLIPPLLLAAAYTVVEWTSIRKRGWSRRTLLSLAVFAVAALISLSNLLHMERDNYTQGYYNVGILYLMDRRYDEAVPHLRKALEEKPLYRNARYNLGLCYTYMGRLDDAERTLVALLRDYPDDTEGRFTFAVILLKKERIAAAAAELMRMIDASLSMGGGPPAEEWFARAEHAGFAHARIDSLRKELKRAHR